MRPNRLVPAALIVLCACAQHGQSTSSSPSPEVTPEPLRSCETREFSLYGADLVVQANVDGTPASIVVVRAADADIRTKAFQDAVKALGTPHPDTRTQTRQFKWGMVQLTDMCGRPVMPSPSPSPT